MGVFLGDSLPQLPDKVPATLPPQIPPASVPMWWGLSSVLMDGLRG